MSNLEQLLEQAFNAGDKSASEIYWNGIGQSFEQWCEENKITIENLKNQLNNEKTS